MGLFEEGDIDKHIVRHLHTELPGDAELASVFAGIRVGKCSLQDESLHLCLVLC